MLHTQLQSNRSCESIWRRLLLYISMPGQCGHLCHVTLTKTINLFLPLPFSAGCVLQWIPSAELHREQGAPG